MLRISNSTILLVATITFNVAHIGAKKTNLDDFTRLSTSCLYESKALFGS